ncbi:hypothetical protein TNCV_3744701 [Trichonephila clavipes]|nr:hypothetical protein TNCV_3744701 [Trichonephila clavipes]
MQRRRSAILIYVTSSVLKYRAENSVGISRLQVKQDLESYPIESSSQRAQIPLEVAVIGILVRNKDVYDNGTDKQHSPSHCVFGAPRTRFGVPALFPSRDVTPVSFSSAALFLQPPPAAEGVE